MLHFHLFPGAGSYPFKLDVFAGRIYWTTLARNVIKTVDQLGQGNVTLFLANQIDVGAVRFVQVDKYNQFSKSATFTILPVRRLNKA